MEVTLRQLRAFTALARTGGFTRAAESLHITQSALSGLIKELESQLGVRLVDRNTRRIQLSEVGREFHSVATRILRDLDGALGLLRSQSARNGGRERRLAFGLDAGPPGPCWRCACSRRGARGSRR